MAQRIAAVARDSQVQRTGHSPTSVTVVLSEDTLVVTLHDALSAAEKVMARTPAGAAQVQEFHRQLFLNSVDALREDIARITGVTVREVAVEVEATKGAVVHAFAGGTMVQVFQLNGVISPDAWNACDSPRS
jgi:uncharacterized protein YbcI